MSTGQLFFDTGLAYLAIFATVVLVHELGHAAVAIAYGRRLFSIRVLSVVFRFRKRRGMRGMYDTTAHIVSRRTGGNGEVRSESSPSRSEDFVFSMAGIACEALLFCILWNSAPWTTPDANHAWHDAVRLNAILACLVTLLSLEPGGDLYFALRCLRPAGVRRRRS